MPADSNEINLLAPQAFATGHPKATYDWLRRNDPIHWHDEPEGTGFWAVTRHEHVKLVGRDSDTYSSEPTIMIENPAEGSEALLGDHKMLLMSDPPYHTRLRRLISKDFTPRGTREMLVRLQELATQIVDEVIERGSCDLVQDLAGEMPSYVIADMMGLPLEDGRELYKLTEILHSATEAVGSERKQEALGQMFGYAAGVYGDKQQNPGDDLSTEIINAEVDGYQLDSVDFALFFLLLIDAGGDTTRNLVAGGMHELFERPDQLELLRSDIDRYLPGAIEEMLRYVSPVVYMRRTVTADHDLGGVSIKEGDKVVMYYGAANRDPEVFEDPESFDITRSNAKDHVAFGGGGPHFCLGANLARLEIEALLREMLERLPDLTPSGPTTWLPSNFISGPTSMPVTFVAGARIAPQ